MVTPTAEAEARVAINIANNPSHSRLERIGLGVIPPIIGVLAGWMIGGWLAIMVAASRGLPLVPYIDAWLSFNPLALAPAPVLYVVLFAALALLVWSMGRSLKDQVSEWGR